MKTKKIRVLLSAIVLVVILTWLYFCQAFYGQWWNKPSFRDNISRIEIFEGSFRVPDQKPIIVFDGKSEETEQIISSVETGWLFIQPIKFGSKYGVDVVYNDKQTDYIGIGSTHFLISSYKNDKPRHTYRVRKDILTTIDEILRKNPNQNMDPIVTTPVD